MLSGDPCWRVAARDLKAEPRIERIEAREIMQDALVNAQRRGRQPLTCIELEQPIAAQRARRRKRAPMRLGERSERETETRRGARSAARKIGAALGDFRFHLDPGAKQQQVALEGAQLEELGERLDRRRRGHPRADRLGGRDVLGPRSAIEQRQEPREFRD